MGNRWMLTPRYLRSLQSYFSFERVNWETVTTARAATANEHLVLQMLENIRCLIMNLVLKYAFSWHILLIKRHELGVSCYSVTVNLLFRLCSLMLAGQHQHVSPE